MTKIISKEGILMILQDNEPIACVRRDDKSGHQVLYVLSEAGAEDFEQILENTNDLPKVQ